MIPELKEYLQKFLQETSAAGIIKSTEKKINHGYQVVFQKENERIPVNFYWSFKKGISVVVGGSIAKELHQQLKRLLGFSVERIETEHTWNQWVGSDESGKGDFFGPLVVCGFYTDMKSKDILLAKGVCDSKKLREDKLISIAEYLLEFYSNNMEIILLTPHKFNDLYTSFASQGRKLNELLAWMHARVVVNLDSRFEFSGAVVDKFCHDRILFQALRDLSDIKVINRINAENDVAVAAASIMARYRFLKYFQKMKSEYGMEFSRGSGEKTYTTGLHFIREFGLEQMPEVAKLNFRNYNILKGRINED